MVIEEKEGHFLVSVARDELKVASGKTLHYPAWIGVIDRKRGIDVWTPAGYVPRGYRTAARKLLEQAQAQLQQEGKLE